MGKGSFSTMRWGLALLLVALVGCLAGRAAAAGEVNGDAPLLRRVEVIGLENGERRRVMEAVPVGEGERLTDYRLARVERVIDDLGLSRPLARFRVEPVVTTELVDGETVPALGGEADLVLDFRPAPTIASVRFFPLIAVAEEAFAAACAFTPGDVYTREWLDRAAGCMQEVAREAGHEEVRITPFHGDLQERDAKLGFLISGRDAPELRKLRFRDAGWGNAAAIRKFLREQEENPFDKGSEVLPERLEEIRVLAAGLLRTQGYLDAKATLDSVTTTDRGAEVIFRVDRGERYRLERPLVVSSALPDSGFWAETVERYEDRPLTVRRLRELDESLKKRAQVKGYMASEVELVFAPDPARATVEVTARVDAGSTSTLGQVRIERTPPERGYGESFYHRHVAPMLSEEVIRRQVRARPGDALDRRAIEDAERRLNNLNLFREVSVDTVATTATPSVRDLLLRVEDRRTASLNLELIWNDQLNAAVAATFTEANIGGRGDVLSVAGVASLQGDGYRGAVSYVDRNWRLGERLIGREREPLIGYSVYYTTLSYREYFEERIGGGVALSYVPPRQYTPWTKGWRLRLEQITYDPYRDPDDYEEEFNSYTAATVTPSLTYDTRTRGDKRSSEGVLYETWLEVGAADGLLVKWSGLAEWRRQVGRDWGWTTTARVSLLPYESTEVGLADRLQSGGLDSIRGFEVRGIGPVDRLEEDLKIGGATSTSLQNELTYYLNDSVDLSAFVDVGTLDREAFRVGTPRLTTGLGVRMQLPGEDRRAFFYLAAPLLSESTDDDRFFHVGVMFPLR